MNTHGYFKSIFLLVFLLFALVLSFWLAPFYQEKTSSFPYLSNAFNQCLTQKAEVLVQQLAKNGGYSSALPGVAHELTIEKAIEAGMGDVFGACEELLLREEPFARELSQVRAVVGKDVSIFLDGRWKGSSGKTIPGFVITISLPLQQSLLAAHEVMQQLDGAVRDAVLASLGKNLTDTELRKSIVRNVEQLAPDVDGLSVHVLVPDVTIRRKEIQLPLQIQLLSGQFMFQFQYPMTFSDDDLQVGCAILGLPQKLPVTKEIIFDCGRYRCIIPWEEKVRLPRLCSRPEVAFNEG
ncbi:hypothetical protein HY639_00275 [Candidatus Woesearchaeota archaeon]|nr:hypothetical protein [Candidatus Woesearchaeota archaeon]